MDAKAYVLAKYPEAICSDTPLKMYWPGKGARLKYIVVYHPLQSSTAGEGDTPEEAWCLAFRKLRMKENPELVEQLNKHADDCPICQEVRRMNATRGMCDHGKRIYQELLSFGV